MSLLRHHRRALKRKPYIGFWSLYPLSILFVFHFSLVAYINSSYMEQYLTPEGISALYIIGSAIAIICFLFFSHALKAIGNVRLTLTLAMIDALSLLVLGLTDSSATAIIAFVTFLVVSPLLFLNIDIFAETIIGENEHTTGSRRGLTLGLMSLSGVAAPLSMGWIATETDSLTSVYFVAVGIFILFIAFLILRFQAFEDPEYNLFRIRTSLSSLWQKRDVRNVMFSHFLLQVFFAWTIVYFPLYLYSELHFAWDEISYIIAFALFAYVVFEWPTGIVADRWLGEKEIMALGFLILAISCSWVAFMNTSVIWAWMALLFITRVGAAFVETTTEVYFFKHTNGGDADTIGFFRLLRPLATVFGAVAGSIALLYLPFNLIFVVLGALLVPGIFFTLALKDTK